MPGGNVTTEPLRLLHVFPSFGIGGAQIRFAQIANHFGTRHRHFVLAIDEDFGTAALLHPDVAIERLDAGFPKQKALAHVRDMRRLMRQVSPDILLTYNWGSIEWALANRWLPIVRRHLHFEDGFGPEESAGQIPRRVWFRRLALGGRHTTLVIPSKVLERLALEHWGIAAARVHYLPNGIDLKRFAAPSSMAAETATRELVVGTIARLRPEKNIARLLAAFACAATGRKARLLVVGDGAERAALERQGAAPTFAGRVNFHGATDRPEDLLRQMDIFALSSDTEQMPISLLEAMASALPVASTDVGDVANMLPEENARFVRGARDEAHLAAQLARLLDDAALRHSLGAANRLQAEREFDESRMLERYEALFMGLAAGTGPPPASDS